MEETNNLTCRACKTSTSPSTTITCIPHLIQGNLRGKASEDAYLKTLPAVEVFSYQCSPLSTSAGIQVCCLSDDELTLCALDHGQIIVL